MLAYTAHRAPRRHLSKPTLLAIVGVHAGLLTMLALAKMDVPLIPDIVRTRIENIPLPEPTPPPPPERVAEPRATVPPPAPRSRVSPPDPLVKTLDPTTTLEVGPPIPTVPDLGPALDTPLGQPALDPPKGMPVKVAARAITPADLLRPPYPESKRRLEEQASLRLRLGIDERGRVVSVEPVGTADPEFLASARAHLLRHWRYRPATEDGRPVATSMVVTLRFLLEE